MYSRDKAIEYLSQKLSKERVEHSVRVMNLALEYARHYGLDEQKVEMASLLHDCGKWKEKKEALKKVADFGIILEDELAYNYNLVHGILGVFIAESEFGIYDGEVLDAIRYHISGRPNMTMIEKVVFLADKLESGRSYEGVDEFRKLAFVDTDKAILGIMDDTIKLLIDRGEFISSDTIDARNWLLKE